MKISAKKFLVTLIAIIQLSVSVLVFAGQSAPVIAQAPEPEISTTLRIPVTGQTQIIKQNGQKKLTILDYLSSTRTVVSGSNINTINYYPYGQKAENIESRTQTLSSRTNVRDPSIATLLRDDNEEEHIQDRGQEAEDRSDTEYETDRLFTGHRKLDDISVYHAGARFYSPRLGQFIQADSVDGPNRYFYTNNNPVAFNDPTGNCPICVVFGLAAVMATMPMSSNAPNTTIQGPPSPGTLEYGALTYGIEDTIEAFILGFTAPVLAGQGGALVGAARTGIAARSISATASACGTNPECLEGTINMGELIFGAETPATFGPPAQPYQRLGNLESRFGRQIGKGVQGSVYGDGTTATKIARGSRGISGEIAAMQRYADSPLILPVHRTVLEDGRLVGYQTDQIGGYNGLIPEGVGFAPGARSRINQNIDDLYKQGFFHGDLHANNVVFLHDNFGKVTGLRLIDLGGPMSNPPVKPPDWISPKSPYYLRTHTQGERQILDLMMERAN